MVDALRVMRQHGIHHLIVTSGATVLGVVSDRDIFGRGAQGDGMLDSRLRVKDVLCSLPTTATDRTDVREALELMRTHSCSALPLVRDGRLTGIITESDLLRLLEASLATDGPTATEKGKVLLSNPLMANLMQLLAEAGI